jgi:hypothetical protein
MSFRNKLALPASQSHTDIVIATCVVTMSLLSIALIWQAQVIANQQESIRWLQNLKFGSY